MDANNTWIALIPETSCAVKAAIPNNGGIYNSMGYLIIEPPTPSIPDIKEPINPIKNITTIKVMSILMPSF
ncbi:hypothetical protein D3C80_1693890 [compost metagenome]